MNILLSGANGKMGREVIKAAKDTDFKITCGLCKDNHDLGFQVYDNKDKIKEKYDVIIDFSTPEGSFKALECAKEKNIPIVIATTGFSKEETAKIKEYSKYIPVFKSSNMSLNISLMSKICGEVAKVLKDTDIEIIETHHNRKVDSPSGTAILLADAINKALKEEKTYNFNRMQKREKRTKNEIGFSSVRGGNIVGQHTVKFFGENESLEITHTAYSRGLFAEGALNAAKFIINKKPGLYTMEDLTK
ncbi:MAG: 4-hydroxy-tetrahydrodipicolinate reductase [Bacilli bacterium]|nr:4-hydroxy-tetrahydrodipicolinate reductase [Bacilli bacterium]